MESKTSSKKPVDTIRRGAITASVFKNSAKKGDRDVSYYKVSIQRTYKDGDKFKTTTSFGRDDLLAVARIAGQAWDYIATAEQSSGGNGEE